MANPIPEGFSTLTPHLIVRGAQKAIEFYKKAFAAEGGSCLTGPDGQTVMHAQLKIGNSMLMIVDEMPMMQHWVSPQQLKGTTVGLCLYVEDCDAVYKRAVEAGATESMKPADAFWGDRYSKVIDPFGHEWEICTHKEDLTPEQIAQRAQACYTGLSEPEI
ncbi:MAG TPA: VOC family protein [Phycisphaerae bacterium]|nr:VOC family protein [Phycisphaerae bacterium]